MSKKVFPYKIDVIEKYVSFYEEHENVVRQEFGIVVNEDSSNIQEKIEEYYRTKYPEEYKDYCFRGKFPQHVEKGYVFKIEIGNVIE